MPARGRFALLLAGAQRIARGRGRGVSDVTLRNAVCYPRPYPYGRLALNRLRARAGGRSYPRFELRPGPRNGTSEWTAGSYCLLPTAYCLMAVGLPAARLIAFGHGRNDPGAGARSAQLLRQVRADPRTRARRVRRRVAGVGPRAVAAGGAEAPARDRARRPRALPARGARGGETVASGNRAGVRRPPAPPPAPLPPGGGAASSPPPFPPPPSASAPSGGARPRGSR